MKTENFDDAIRRKIESIQHQYSEEDIDRVHSYVIHHKAFPWKSYAWIAAVVTTIIMMGGLLTWDVMQQEENEFLLQKIDSLQHKLSHVEVKMPLVKTDTVYITKYVTQSSTPNKNSNTTRVNNSRKNSTPAEAITEEQAQQRAGSTKIKLQEKYTAANTATKKQGTENSNTALNTRKETAPITQSNTENNTSEKQNRDASYKTNAPDTDTPTPATIANNPDKKQDELKTGRGENENNMQDKTPVALAKAPETFVKDSMVTTPPALSQNTGSTTDTDTLPAEKTKSHASPLLFFSTLNYRLGAGVEAAKRGQAGASLVAEVVLSPRWSFSAGLKVLNMRHDKFNDANEFRFRNGKEFRGGYIPKGPDTSFVSNIDMMNSLFQIPLTLNYTLPLKNKYTLLLGVGTDMDLYAVQRTGYEHKGPSNHPESERIEKIYPTLLFNNIVLSAGIEKTWNRFALQATPFISPQLTAVAYKREDMYVGLRVRGLFSFGM